MNISGLSFNALPPIDLPFRFFICAPLFMIACALIIFFFGEPLWLSRWHPGMLALTHGFTLGFLTLVMMGALLQLLPVIGGIGIARPRLTATVSHSLYVFGVIALISSFLTANPWLTQSALVLLSLAFIFYLSAVVWVLVKKMSQGDSINAFRLAIAAFIAALVLGVMLLASRGGLTYSFGFVDKHFTDIHAMLGLVGWASLLIIGVSFQVLPMFHVAPNMPQYIRKYLPISLGLLLLGFAFYGSDFMALIFIAHAIYALSLLYVINQRKRKVPDTSIKYWQLAAISLLVLNVLYFLPDSFYTVSDKPFSLLLPDKTMLLTAIFIYFNLLSVIQAMLLKILPFLSYTHLQQRCLTDFSAMQHIPHMHEFLNKQHGLILYCLHILSGLTLVAVIIKPSLYLALSLLVFVEFTWLLMLMVRCMHLYFSVNQKINLSNNS